MILFIWNSRKYNVTCIDRKHIIICLGIGGTVWKGEITKGCEKTSEDDRHVYYINCDDGLPVSVYVKTHEIVHFEYVQFMSILLQ